MTLNKFIISISVCSMLVAILAFIVSLSRPIAGRYTYREKDLNGVCIFEIFDSSTGELCRQNIYRTNGSLKTQTTHFSFKKLKMIESETKGKIKKGGK